LDLISSILRGTNNPRNGSITTLDFDYKPVTQIDFTGALLTEVTVPALDASSKDSAYLTLKLLPESARSKKPSGEAVKAAGAKEKAALIANFKFELDGVDGTRVSKIDSFTIKQIIASDDIGIFRENTKHPIRREIPNLKVTFSDASRPSWQQWADDWFINGKHSESDERSGSITFLSSDMKTPLLRIKLSHVGLVRLGSEKMEASAEQIRRSQADLYVEKIEFDLGTDAPASADSASPPSAPAATESAPATPLTPTVTTRPRPTLDTTVRPRLPR
jgi:hypothetical protein